MGSAGHLRLEWAWRMAVDQEEPTRGEVLALYGEAMLAVQQLEEAMVGLLGVRKELSVLMQRDLEPISEDVREFERCWEGLFSQTGGYLRGELRLAGQLGQEVERAVRARNLLAHHYLRDHKNDLDKSSGRSAIATRLGASADRFRELAARIDVEHMAALQAAGLSDDHVTTVGEARRMRYYDPALDDAVAPEPFEE